MSLVLKIVVFELCDVEHDNFWQEIYEIVKIEVMSSIPASQAAGTLGKENPGKEATR